jgi:hypothetical protein
VLNGIRKVTGDNVLNRCTRRRFNLAPLAVGLRASCNETSSLSRRKNARSPEDACDFILVCGAPPSILDVFLWREWLSFIALGTGTAMQPGTSRASSRAAGLMDGQVIHRHSTITSTTVERKTRYIGKEISEYHSTTISSATFVVRCVAPISCGCDTAETL